jgi:hypothetical protein
MSRVSRLSLKVLLVSGICLLASPIVAVSSTSQEVVNKSFSYSETTELLIFGLVGKSLRGK